MLWIEKEAHRWFGHNKKQCLILQIGVWKSEENDRKIVLSISQLIYALLVLPWQGKDSNTTNAIKNASWSFKSLHRDDCWIKAPKNSSLFYSGLCSYIYFFFRDSVTFVQIIEQYNANTEILLMQLTQIHKFVVENRFLSFFK